MSFVKNMKKIEQNGKNKENADVMEFFNTVELRCSQEVEEIEQESMSEFQSTVEVDRYFLIHFEDLAESYYFEYFVD